jgi:hypothetical protein
MQTRLTRTDGPAPKRGRLGAGGAYTDQCSPPRNPVESAALPLHETVIRNEGTGRSLSVVVDPPSRSQPHAGVWKDGRRSQGPRESRGIR